MADLWVTAAVAASIATGTVTIENDNGGAIVDYAQRARIYRENGAHVRIMGECYSACTIYLSLPPEQLCIGSGARFHFHRVTGGDWVSRAFHNRWLMETWPVWARKWILDSGGLTAWFKAMPFEYASRHLPICR